MKIVPHPFVRDYERVKRSLWSRIKKDFFRKYDLKKVKTAYVCNGFIYMSPKCVEAMIAEDKEVEKMLEEKKRRKTK